MSVLDDAPLVHASDRAAWRAWLEEHHATARGAWLVMRRPGAGESRRGGVTSENRVAGQAGAEASGVDYEAAVEEALCFGWIDGQSGRLDAETSRQYFAPRKPRSAWSASNRARVARLLAAGLMAPAGVAAVELAQANGMWGFLEQVERLEVPGDLAAALAAAPPAASLFAAFTPSSRRAILAWIASARRPETRAARVRETATRAQHNERANERRRED